MADMFVYTKMNKISAAAEGATLANYIFNELKSKKKKKPARISLFQQIVTKLVKIIFQTKNIGYCLISQKFARCYMHSCKAFASAGLLWCVFLNI